MSDLFGAELLINPSQMAESSGSGMTEPKEIAIADLDAIELDVLPDAPAPSLVPKPEDIGQHTTDDGFVNLNAESFMPQAAPASATGRALTPVQINERKRKILSYFDRMQRRGRAPSRRFTMDDSLEDLETEKKAMSSDNNMEFAMAMMEKVTIGIATMAEKTAAAVPRTGVRLAGYSNSVNDTMDDFYPIFEEFWDKHNDWFQFGPEVKYVYLLGMSAYMTHMTNTFTQAYGPPAGDVLRDNPDLARQFAQKFMEKTMGSVRAAAPAPAPVPAPAPPPARDIISEMLAFTGLPGGGPPNMMASQPKPSTAPVMRGPQNMDDILKDINVVPPPVPGGSKAQPRTGILKKPKSERTVMTVDL